MSEAKQNDPRLDEPMYASDLFEITRLDAESRGIEDLHGLEFMTNLRTLNLAHHVIENLEPLEPGRFTGGEDYDGSGPVSRTNHQAAMDLVGADRGSSNLEHLALDVNPITVTLDGVGGSGSISALNNLHQMRYLSIDRDRQLGRDAGDFYRPTIMSAEPIGYYRRDEDTELTAFDESRNTIDGRIIDSVRLAVPGTLKGRESLAYEFHPGAGQVQLDNLPVVTAVDGKNTVTFWMFSWKGASCRSDE